MDVCVLLTPSTFERTISISLVIEGSPLLGIKRVCVCEIPFITMCTISDLMVNESTSPLWFDESTIGGIECATIIINDDTAYETTNEVFQITLQPSPDDLDITFENSVLTLTIIDDDRKLLCAFCLS